MTAWSFSGGASSVAPAQAAPSSRAKARSRSLRAKTKIFARGKRWRTAERTRCAEAPKPVRPRFSPSPEPVRRSDRQPIAPAQRSGAASAVGEDLRDGVGEGLGHGHEFRIAAVRVTARGAESCAEVLVAGAAGVADPAGPVDPADPDPFADPEPSGMRPPGGDRAHDLVPRDDRKGGRRRPPLDLVELRMADAAGGHGDEDLPLTGHRFRQLDRNQRRRVFGE